jgi:hypothetical protein
MEQPVHGQLAPSRRGSAPGIYEGELTMEFEISSVKDTTTVTDVRAIRADVTSDDLHTDNKGAEWLPDYAYLEYVRIDGGTWKIRTALLWGNNLRADKTPGKKKFKQTFVSAPGGQGLDSRYSWGALRSVIVANWPEEK